MNEDKAADGMAIARAASKRQDRRVDITYDARDDMSKLTERVTKLEAKGDALVKGLEWAAEQIKPMYLVGGVAPVLAAVAKGLK